ncbi:MAG: PAS domain-containing protein [Spirochaetia bacterium]|nr:PAS domain-containing protein [Spirochaetia bacterium]
MRKDVLKIEDQANQNAENTLDELVRASSLLSREINFKQIITVLVDQSLDITHSDLACLYLFTETSGKKSKLKPVYKRGSYTITNDINEDSDFLEFIEECNEAIAITERKKSPFAKILLHEKMQSGIALPVNTRNERLGILFINSNKALFYNREKFHFLDSFVEVAGNLFHNSTMVEELRNHLSKIEKLERYQENIFTSMNNLLITTDSKGCISYYNQTAKKEMGFDELILGQNLQNIFKSKLDKKIITAIEDANKSGRELLGLEGILKKEKKEIDFSLNISPLKSKRGKNDGIVLLFTDQSKERELKKQIKIVSEERRAIKDMFSRYLSNEVVTALMESPELVKLGGAKKTATIFFADIRGYTSFSETKSPEHIIEILNEYFSEAVEIIIKNKGFIDKFIGDCIMAAWGVPMVSEKEDAISAVTSAVEIQNLLKSRNRHFFKGDASHLKVGIGMHTGPLVAGNLGSQRRMDYSVIGDTVNIAARLEGVSKAGEIIITEDTRKFLDNIFKLEKREAVKVKGKEKPLQIYNVLGKR